MVDDSKVQVLIERVNNSLDGQKKIEGKLDLMVNMQLTIAAMQEQMKSFERGQARLFTKSDEFEEVVEKIRTDDIGPLRDDMIGNKRALRVLAIVGGLVLSAAGALYSQWKPWQVDFQAAKQARDDQMARYSQDVGKELQSNDRRLTVLEFRANNTDGKVTK